MTDFKNLLKVIGPGILYAAAAVGVSHLVQATTAGAVYGLALVSTIIFICVIKYPAIRFGADYAAATGKNLISFYMKTGWWVAAIYILTQVVGMVFILAAICLVTVGLFKTVLEIGLGEFWLMAGLLFISIILLISGRYHLLERVVKFIVAVFTVLILLAVVMVVGRIDWSLSNFVIPELNAKNIMFMVALAGIMPTPMDASVLQSLWTCARGEDRGVRVSTSDARLDFNVGYSVSVALALCFLILGTGVMHNAGVPLAQGAGGFSAQVISLFTETIGSWTYPIIGTAAIAVMVSTVFTVLDGYPRILEAVVNELKPELEGKLFNFRIYDVMIVVLSIGALMVFGMFMASFGSFIELTAVIVFVISPLLAFLNHRAVFGAEISAEARPSELMRIWSIVGVVVMIAVTALYFYLRLTA